VIIILDTNILLSSVMYGGRVSRVHNFCLSNGEVYISKFILDELEEKLLYKFKIENSQVEYILAEIASTCITVLPKGVMPEICRDPDDNNILHLAKSVHADFIISGDKDLTDLKFFKQTEIISPRDFAKRFIEEQ
jgi:putative PIN family toxin of toxin-antitoxin system